MSESKILDDLTWFKNPPVETTFIEFQRNPELRRSFYTEYLLQHNFLTEVQWSRPDDSKYPLSDLLNEMSKVKIWVNENSESDQSFRIKTVDVFAEINKNFPKYVPSTRCILDSSISPPEPVQWEILRNLFVDKFCLMTVKQQRSNPRNVVLRLVPRRHNKEHQICQPNSPAVRQDQTLHLVGTLKDNFEEFESLQVIR